MDYTPWLDPNPHGGHWPVSDGRVKRGLCRKLLLERLAGAVGVTLAFSDNPWMEGARWRKVGQALVLILGIRFIDI